jgi:solute carrier family 25 citrate transporter 1
MSRNGDKKPVGFATHIIAGGIAGGCEAVSISSRETV